MGKANMVRHSQMSTLMAGVFVIIGLWQVPALGSAIVWDGGTGNWFGPWLGNLPGNPIPIPTPTTNWTCEFCYPVAGNTVNIGTDFGSPIGPVSGTAILSQSTTVAGVALGNGAFGGLQVTAGTLTLTGGLTVGTSGAASGALTVAGGVVNTPFAWLGQLAGTNGATMVSGTGSQLNVSGSQEFLVGRQGTGTLSIQSGGLVTSNNAVIGELSGSSGAATVAGSGARWNDSGTLTIGQSGQGTLTISSGGAVSSAGGNIAVSAGSSGSVLVTGTGSQWNNSSSLGIESNGSLTVSNGGVVNVVNNGVLSSDFGSATVTGTGSQWNTGAGLTVGTGSPGTGVLTIQSGGIISSNSAGLGQISGGTVIVAGQGSQWNTSLIEVGTGIAASSLTVQNGGVVNTAADGGPISQIGQYGNVLIAGGGSQWNGGTLSIAGTVTVNGGGVGNFGGGGTIDNGGSVTVSDSGSQLNTGRLVVGNNSHGTLTIQNGAQASSAEGIIAANTGSSGNVLVTGTGSQWNLNTSGPNNGTLTNNLLIGSGTLTIANGGNVNSAGVGSVSQVYGSGSVLVAGPGSSWNTNVLIVGAEGAGSLTIQGGGVVNSTYNMVIGFVSGAGGSVMVSGIGSELSVAALGVGDGAGASGNLTLNHGASGSSGVIPGDGIAVLIGPGISLGGSAGVMNLSDAGTIWINAYAPVLVGDYGTGTLNVQNGAIFISEEGDLVVGQNGNGTMVITTGGQVYDINATVGSASGSTGNVLIDAGTWTNTGSLEIGVAGTGVVTVMDGGNLSAGDTTVGSNGSLVIDPSDVDISGNFTLSPNGLLSLDIGGTTPDLLSQLDISGSGLFQGVIVLDFIDGFAPTTGESFDLINALGGADFSSVTLQIEGLEPGFEYTDTFANGEFVVTADNNGVSTAPEPGSLWLVSAVLSALSLMVAGKKLTSRLP